jgi:hypothetical protein
MAKSARTKAGKTEEMPETKAEEIVEVAEEKVVIEQEAPKIIIMQPSPAQKLEVKKTEGATLAERILNYVKNSGGQTEINTFLKLEFKTLVEQQEVSKQIKGVLSKLVAEKKITVKENFDKLGRFYYHDGNPVTQYYNAANTTLTVALV